MTSNFGAKIPLNVQPGGVNSTLKGIDYQVKLMVLAVIKSYENPNNSDFDVSTEIAEAEPFDDVILQVKNGGSRFIQCKSKENPFVLSFYDFFDKKNKNFLLSKYFSGYTKIKKNFKKCEDFVVCTNNLIPNSQSLLDQTGTGDEIRFQMVTGSDELFGNYSQRFKLDPTCKTTIRKRLIQDLSTPWFSATQKVDKDVDGFISNLLFVFDMRNYDVDKEIDIFIQKQFNLTAIDCPRSILMCTLYTWIRCMKIANTINKDQFNKYLKEIKDNSKIIPNVIDRSENLFRSTSFEFKTKTEVSDFVLKVLIGKNQLFYMQMKDGDTCYGSCMINQVIKPKKTSDEFLFLSTSCPFDIEDGLKIFELKNCFDFLIFVESKETPIQNDHKNQLMAVLSKNKRKKALIITDQMKSQFAAELIKNDENLLTIQQVKLSGLTQQSLDSFLGEKQLKLQDEIIQLENILDSKDQSLIDAINLKDLQDIQSIGGNVIEGKNFNSDLYIERKILHRHIIKDNIQEVNNNDKIVADESSFYSCCIQFPESNIHQLEPLINGNGLVWKKSRGKIDFLLNHVDTDQGTEIVNPWNLQVTANKTFILVDIPGMGKTSWMNHLASELKLKQKDYFIVNISFNDHTEYFQYHKFREKDSVLSFLECEVLELRNAAEKELFRVACTKTGKVQVILDGLDEVCPDSESEMLEMIEQLSKMPVSGIYISTRPGLKRTLEQKMQNFAHEFVPFSQENQQNFLIKFWSRDSQVNLSDDELRVVAEKIILTVKEKNLTQIAGIPLIMRMMAEIFDSDLIAKAHQNNAIVETTIFKVTQLYEKFVNKNIKRHLIEKLELDLSKKGNRRIAERENQKFLTLYKKVALKLILPQHLYLFYRDYELTPDELAEMVECGLILSASELKFIHRTIAEFFVSLAIQEKLHDENIAIFVVKQIFSQEKFGVIRTFLNSSIENFGSGMELFGSMFINNKAECKMSTKIACKEKNENILRFIFESFFAIKSVTIKFVQGILDRDFLKLYVQNMNDNLKIFKLVEEKAGLRTLSNLFLVKNHKKVIKDPFNMKVKSVQTMFPFTPRNQIPEPSPENFDIIKWSMKNPSNCHLMLSMLRQNFYDTEFWEKFQNRSSELLRALLEFKYDKEIFNQILNEICQIESEKKIYCFDRFFRFEIFTEGQFKSGSAELFLSFFINAKGFKRLIQVLLSGARSYEVLSEYLVQFSYCNQLFYSLCKIAFRQTLENSKCQNQNYYQEIREKLIEEKLKMSFSEQELNEFRSLPNVFKVTGERVEFIHYEVLLCSCKLYFCRNCNDLQINQILLHDLVESDNFDGILDYIISDLFKSQESLVGRFLLDHLIYDIAGFGSQLHPMSIKNFCLKLKRKKFYLSYYRRRFLRFLMSSMISAVNSEEDQKKLNWILSFEDDNHQAIEWPGDFYGFWKHCKEIFAPDFDFSFKENCDSDDDCIKDKRLIFKLTQWIVEKHGNDHHTLLYQDCDGETLLHYFSKADDSIYLKLFKVLSNESLKELFPVKNHLGQTCFFHYRRSFGDIPVIIQEKFGYNYLENLLLEKDEDGDVFLVTVNNFTDFFDRFGAVLTKETIRKLLLNRNLKEQNLLYGKSRDSCVPVLRDIFKKFGRDKKLFKELLNKKDKNNETFLEFAEREGFLHSPNWYERNANVATYFEKFLNENFPSFLKTNQISWKIKNFFYRLLTAKQVKDVANYIFNDTLKLILLIIIYVILSIYIKE